MNDDYLWDGSGAPDPEVQRLEKLLSRFRHDRPAPEFSPAERPPPRNRFPFLLPRLVGALVAIGLVVAGTWFALRSSRPVWEVSSLSGAPRVGSERIGRTGRLALGQSLETDSGSRAKINVGQIGEVEVEPDTRIRLVEARPTEHRLALAARCVPPSGRRRDCFTWTLLRLWPWTSAAATTCMWIRPEQVCCT
jgi:hypothetical protein